MNTKVCTRCKTEKPLAEYYQRTASPDGKDYYCRSCRRNMATHRSSGVKPVANSTVQVQELLAARGIPSVSGWAAGSPYTDLMAWACVPVEAKGANLNGAGAYRWTFSEHVRRDGLRGVFVFLAWHENQTRVFVVPSSADWLCDSQGRPRRACLSVAIDSTHHMATIWKRLKHYENAYHHIEDYRLSYMLMAAD